MLKSSLKIVDQIDVKEAYAELVHSGSGSINTFIGTVRELTYGELVTGLSFEAYEPMVIKEMLKIAEHADTVYELNKLVIWHAVGTKHITDPVVFMVHHLHIVMRHLKPVAT